MWADACPKCGARRIDAQLGLERTPEEYVANLVAVFREVRRVLRPDGTLWLVLGDSYVGGNNTNQGGNANFGSQPGRDGMGHTPKALWSGLAPKNLVGIPWRVAFALQADGWWLRQDIIWSKPNPMPESVRDRCTKSHEYIFMLSKSARYYYDAEAVKEEAEFVGPNGPGRKGSPSEQNFHRIAGKNKDAQGPLFRNRRSVWTITTKPYSEAHFATFPPELPEICVKAGTSEKGACPECGSPWERVIKRTEIKLRPNSGGIRGHSPYSSGATGQTPQRASMAVDTQTLGWRPTCSHSAPPVPCVVLDPFFGAGTTGLVAKRLGRNFIGIELSPKYCEMAGKRIFGEMFHGTEVRHLHRSDEETRDQESRVL